VANQLQNQSKSSTPNLKLDAAQPDQFQKSAGAGLDYLRDRRRPLFIAGAVIIGGALLGLLVMWLFSNTHEKAGDKLAWISDTAVRPIEKEGIFTPERRTGRPPMPRFASEAEKQKILLDEWKKFQQNYSGAAVTTAKLAEASLLFEQASFPEAAKSFQSFLENADASVGMLAVTRENLAYSFEAQNKIDEAIDTFKTLYRDDAKGFYASTGRFHVARLLEKKGQKDEAIKEYKAIITDFETNFSTQEAERRLQALGIDPPKNEKAPKQLIEE
jgi:predicted negative regulator of RcsB-dependent stress response